MYKRQVAGSAAATSATSTKSPGLASKGIAAPTARYVGEVAALVGGALGVAAVLL